ARLRRAVEFSAPAPPAAVASARRSLAPPCNPVKPLRMPAIHLAKGGGLRHGSDKMSELNTIEAALQKAAQRRRLDRALRGALRGLFVASILWLVALIVYKLRHVPFEILALIGATGLVCVLGGAVAGGWCKLSTNETARWVDVKQNLKERLSTALE